MKIKESVRKQCKTVIVVEGSGGGGEGEDLNSPVRGIPLGGRPKFALGVVCRYPAHGLQAPHLLLQVPLCHGQPKTGSTHQHRYWPHHIHLGQQHKNV